MKHLIKILTSLFAEIDTDGIVTLSTYHFMPGFFDRFENISCYVRYKFRFDRKSKGRLDSILEFTRYEINMIDINDHSLVKMGLYHNWNRSYHAHMINSHCKQFPAALVFDIFFPILKIERINDAFRTFLTIFKISFHPMQIEMASAN